MHPESSRALRWVALLPYLWVVAVVAVAITHAFPQTDDFCTFGRLFRSSGGNPFAETWSLYLHWTGRYSASFAVAVTGWLAGISPLPFQWTYAGVLLAFLVLFLLACMQASRMLAARGAVNLPLAMILCAAVLALMPSKLEGATWLTGAAVYMLSVSFALLAFRAVEQSTASGRTGDLLLSSSLLAVTVGFNELVALVVGAWLVVRLPSQRHDRGRMNRSLLHLGVFAIFFGASVLAPGNFVRDATMATPRHDLAQAFALARESYQLIVSELIQPNAWALALLFAAAAAAGAIVYRGDTPRRARDFVPLAVALLVALPLHLVVYSFLTGERIPARVLNQALALALVGTLLAASWLGGRWSARLRAAGDRRLLWIVLVAGVVLVAGAPFRYLATTTRDFGPIWQAHQEARHQALIAARVQGISHPALKPLPSERVSTPVLSGADITADPENWINRCVADFYGVERVALAP